MWTPYKKIKLPLFLLHQFKIQKTKKKIKIKIWLSGI